MSPGPDPAAGSGAASFAGGASGGVDARLQAWLAARPKEAFFLSEVEVGLRREGQPTDRLLQAVEKLEADGRIAVARYTWDDPHLPADGFVLLTAGGRGDPAAAERLEAAWGRWLKEFLGSHRCM
jgi:hypothetical protein